MAFWCLLEENPRVVDYCRMVLKKCLPADRYEYAIEYLIEEMPQAWAEMSYDPAMWLTLVEQVTVLTDRKLLFSFIDGHETVIAVPERTRPSPKRIPLPEPEVTDSEENDTSEEDNICMMEGDTEMETPTVKKARRRLSEYEKQMIIAQKLKGYGQL